MEEWPLAWGIRLHVYLMQTSSLETCRGEVTQHTPPRILSGSWQTSLPPLAQPQWPGECNVLPFSYASCTVHREQQTQKDFIYRLHRLARSRKLSENANSSELGSFQML